MISCLVDQVTDFKPFCCTFFYIFITLKKRLDRNKDADVENGLEDTGGSVSWDEVREWHGLIYTTKCKIDS